MATYGRRTSAKHWARLAMKVGLFLTDAKLWSSLTQQMREHADDFGDVVRDSYDETSNRLSNARAAIRGETHWIGPVASFVGGIGVGIGVGMLLAPVSGEEARGVIRNRATEMTDRVRDYTSGARFRTGAAPTGTEGD